MTGVGTPATVGVMTEPNTLPGGVRLAGDERPTYSDGSGVGVVRFRVCGCTTDTPCDEARHRHNAEQNAISIGWTAHEAAVADHG